MNFNIRFYLIALVFVIFDVEVAFLYPVTVVFRDWVLKGQGALALAEIGPFSGFSSWGWCTCGRSGISSGSSRCRSPSPPPGNERGGLGRAREDIRHVAVNSMPENGVTHRPIRF